MKKTTAILLFWVLMLPSVGYLFVFLIPRAQIRKEMEERLTSDIADRDLVLLKIPIAVEDGADPSFQRFHEREFRYRGNMYDVVRQEKRGDTTWYYCLFDENETALYNRQNDRAQPDWAPNQDKRKLIEELNQPLRWCYLTGPEKIFLFEPLTRSSISSYSFSLKAWLDQPDPPPPKDG